MSYFHACGIYWCYHVPHHAKVHRTEHQPFEESVTTSIVQEENYVVFCGDCSQLSIKNDYYSTGQGRESLSRTQ
jgi:hypothetical protein